MDKYGEFKRCADVLVPERILDRPTRRLKAMEQLRAELIQATDDVNRRIKEIYVKIQTNLYKEDAAEGLLEIDFANYEDCFYVDVPQIK